MLRELADAQDQLSEELTEQVASLREGLPVLPEPGDERAERTIAAEQSEAREAEARKRAATVEKLADALREAWNRLDDVALAEIADLRSRLSRASAAVDQVAADAFAEQPQPGTGGEAWREMWEAARRFVVSEGGSFPDDSEDAVCLTCQQDLDEAARERMRRFEAFVSGDLREQVRQVDRALIERLEALPDLSEIAHAAEVAVAAGGEELRPAADTALHALADRLALATGASDPRLTEALELRAMRDYVALQVAQAEGFAVLRDEEEQARIESRLRELRNRRQLEEALPDLLAHLDGLEAIVAREEARMRLSTTAISHRLRELSKLAITGRLKQALEAEIGEMDPIAERVELGASASKGKPSVRFKLRSGGRERVGKVLSTGEQTALATAFFLAELQVGSGRSAIILDDPVSSLDHQRREHVAERLVEEARRRQVVILTHDLVFVYYLQEKAEELGVDLQFE